jgi:CoA-transferase family III
VIDAEDCSTCDSRLKRLTEVVACGAGDGCDRVLIDDAPAGKAMPISECSASNRIRVLDFTSLLRGLLAFLLLAEAGTEVIKSERLEIGDEMKLYWPRFVRRFGQFRALNL